MPVNLDKPHLWKTDIARSVDMYNDWFINFAPRAFRETRVGVTKDVERALKATRNLMEVELCVLQEHPEVLSTLRMATCPPLAVDRLIGLANVSGNLVKSMEKQNRLPSRIDAKTLEMELKRIGDVIKRMVDPDIFVWIGRENSATKKEVYRAATIVADRLCGSVANPIIRNAQEKRQLTKIGAWLESRHYERLPAGEGTRFDKMPPGTFSFRMNVPVAREDGGQINLPVDAVVMPMTAGDGDLPLLLEAKSAGDYANVNKRRKEEAVKMLQLRRTYGASVKFNLFLCGYFDSGYLGYEAAEGIDWVWEHRIDDLVELGL